MPPREPAPDLPKAAGALIAAAYHCRNKLPAGPNPASWDRLDEPWPDYRAQDRIDSCFICLQLRGVAPLFEIPLPNVYPRPASSSTAAAGGAGICASDFAAILINLATWGLPIDPTPWVQALRPPLLKRRFITASELRILWFPREQGRFRATLPQVEWPDDVPPSFVTASGRKIEQWLDGARATRARPSSARLPAIQHIAGSRPPPKIQQHQPASPAA